jgi:hypothetical protein
MSKYSFTQKLRTPRSLSLTASLALIIGVLGFINLPVRTQGRQASDLPTAPTGQQAQKAVTTSEKLKPTADIIANPSSVFIKLADSVGQSVPAKRLMEFSKKAGAGRDQRYFVIVDFNQPSNVKRMYVFDTQLQKIDRYYTSHGRGSEGASDDGMADVFSNEDSSNSSSLGIYRTMDEYVGKHGRSMRLEGLEPSNSNALDRAIVLHRADYVSESVIKSTGRLGRSQGCFAVENAVADMLIDKLKGGAYIIAWKS